MSQRNANGLKFLLSTVHENMHNSVFLRFYRPGTSDFSSLLYTYSSISYGLHYEKNWTRPKPDDCDRI